MAQHIIIRADTAANWTTHNPTPADNEICYDTTNKRFKVGDGLTAYESLDYVDKNIPHSALSGTHNLTTDIDHDQLTNFLANEHIDWTQNQSGTTIHEDNLPAGIGGGGGGSLEWNDAEAEAPEKDALYETIVHKFTKGDAGNQKLYAIVKVPENYAVGKQVKMHIKMFSETGDGSSTIFLKSTSYLLRPGTDAIDSTSNSHASTNSAKTLSATAKRVETESLDLSDASGEINSVAISAGDLIKVVLERGSDTDTDNINFLSSSSETSFTG